MQGPLGRGERPINTPQRQVRQFSNLAPALQQRPRHTHHRQGILHRRRRDVALRQIKWQLNRLQRLGHKTRRPLPSVAVDHAPGRSVQREAKNEFGAWTIAVKDQISDQFANGFPLQRHTITAHAIRPHHNALLPMATLFPTTHQARVIYRNQHRLDINQPSPSQAQCCELRQLTKSRQWHTTLPTVFMLSTITCLNHSLSETFKGATSSK